MGGVTVLFVSVEMQAEVAFTNSNHVKKNATNVQVFSVGVLLPEVCYFMPNWLLEVLFKSFRVSPSRLVPLLAEWPERGLEPLPQCLRASTAKTLTHGFFVALLEKHSEPGNTKQELAVQIR